MLILDETNKLLLDRLVTHLPKKRQTMLFYSILLLSLTPPEREAETSLLVADDY